MLSNGQEHPLEDNRALFERAVSEHSGRLLAIARGVLGRRGSGEDVVQQALLNLFVHRDRYDWREPMGLMRRTVVNEALRTLRRPRMASVEEEQTQSLDPGPGDAMDRTETIAQVRHAMDRLPENFRAVLMLCEFEQLSYEQIAQTMNITLPQVKTWLHRARRKMEQDLEKYVKQGRPVKPRPPMLKEDQL